MTQPIWLPVRDIMRKEVTFIPGRTSVLEAMRVMKRVGATVLMVEKRDEQDCQGRVVGESSRQKKLMQNYFEKREDERKEEKRLRLDTSDRGLNWHQMSLGKYKNGTLWFSKAALERLDKGDVLGGAYKSAGVVGDNSVKIG